MRIMLLLKISYHYEFVFFSSNLYFVFGGKYFDILFCFDILLFFFMNGVVFTTRNSLEQIPMSYRPASKRKLKTNKLSTFLNFYWVQ